MTPRMAVTGLLSSLRVPSCRRWKQRQQKVRRGVRRAARMTSEKNLLSCCVLYSNFADE
ncbi:hypothetical protein SELSPUOL_00368 [Selenomonas sputigena ATCC 35185]|uniref:Uncharacterized protein n=1 Tax=Selenomonas sputigena (strain ATCC 35185 / DSM 20758 / CCUG 44933 / VPI D19B-28) TaxID=546271 RepID=C9LSE5_SELS3|nr:hypothetical protein SELSPUOL_00368 [Selenomonas sputigena ATCC 35185]